MPRYVMVLFLIAALGIFWAIVTGVLSYLMDSEFVIMLSLGGMVAALSCIMLIFLAFVITTIREDW